MMKNNKRVFALGFFDGVHLGHQALLEQCVRLAGELDASAAAITFEAHPQSLFTDDPPPLINTEADRKRLLRQYGMDSIYRIPVTNQVMSTSWRRFLTELTECGAAGFVCGHDFRFGHRGEGDAGKLKAFCDERAIPCAIVPEQTVEGIRVSSTHIRSLIGGGEMARAVKFLGHPHILTGTVVPGRQLGRTIGIPTANLTLPEGLLAPRFGVYACQTVTGGKKYPAVTNIGTRPTVGGHRITVEAWLPDFSGDLYGQELTLEFYHFLRPERKFDSLEALGGQIRADAAAARDLFRGR